MIGPGQDIGFFEARLLHRAGVAPTAMLLRHSVNGERKSFAIRHLGRRYSPYSSTSGNSDIIASPPYVSFRSS
jgi:hypothetical protein